MWFWSWSAAYLRGTEGLLDTCLKGLGEENQKDQGDMGDDLEINWDNLMTGYLYTVDVQGYFTPKYTLRKKQLTQLYIFIPVGLKLSLCSLIRAWNDDMQSSELSLLRVYI